jgi:hypothetical protein
MSALPSIMDFMETASQNLSFAFLYGIETIVFAKSVFRSFLFAEHESLLIFVVRCQLAEFRTITLQRSVISFGDVENVGITTFGNYERKGAWLLEFDASP